MLILFLYSCGTSFLIKLMYVASICYNKDIIIMILIHIMYSISERSHGMWRTQDIFLMPIMERNLTVSIMKIKIYNVYFLNVQ